MAFKKVVLGFILACLACQSNCNPLSQEFIDEINSKAETWTAGKNFDEKTAINFIRDFSDTIDEKPLPRLKLFDARKDIPETFDSRTNWLKCISIGLVWDQGSCRSDWAISAAQVMSDRICVQKKKNFNVSVNYLMTCCKECGFGCEMGFTRTPWEFWIEKGIVSGGVFKSKNGCQPYLIPPCKRNRYSFCGQSALTPQCLRICNPDYPIPFKEDKSYGAKVYNPGPYQSDIQRDILANGPVEATIAVYEDFLHYKKGVYKHTYGRLQGGHSIRIIGWGKENNVDYWLVSNSWGKEWGDVGLFKILRGVNHCGIEASVIAGIPK